MYCVTPHGRENTYGCPKMDSSRLCLCVNTYDLGISLLCHCNKSQCEYNYILNFMSPFEGEGLGDS